MDHRRRGRGRALGLGLIALALVPLGTLHARAGGDADGPAAAPPPPAEETPAAPADDGPRVHPIFALRTGDHVAALRESGVGSMAEEQEEAVVAALDWLALHRSGEGFWDCDGFMARCGEEECGGPGSPAYDVGVTGLALLAFLGHGATDDHPRYGTAVGKGLAWLESVQDDAGCFGPRRSPHFVYNHAIATLAMAEAAAMTGLPGRRKSAERGVALILEARNPGLAWRYGIRPQDNDSSITAWMTIALKTAEWAGLEVDPAAYEGALAWVEQVTDPETGRAGYTGRGNGPARPMELMDRFPPDRSEALTALAVLVRLLSGVDEDDGMVRKGAALCAALPPVWDGPAGTIDMYYWFYGTQVMYQLGGGGWREWSKALSRALVGNQDRSDGHERGSWDPAGPWGPEGGRVYSTALCAIALEAPYRHGRASGTLPGMATLTVRSDPDGARVYTNDRFRGTTPLKEVPLLPGVSRVRMTHPEASPHEFEVAAKSEEKVDLGNVALPEGGWVDLSGLPGDVEGVFEGLEVRGKFPVRPGRVRLLLSRRRQWPQVVAFEIAAGEVVVPEVGEWEAGGSDWSKAAVRRLPPPPKPDLGGKPLPPGIVEEGGRLYSEKDGAEMVVVPEMRTTVWVDGKQEEATMPAFLVDRHEVTVSQYLAFCKDMKRSPPKLPSGVKGLHPVVNVSVGDARGYAAWCGKRLPTPGEWTRAAFGRVEEGGTRREPVFPWGEWDRPKARNLPGREDGFAASAPVGQFPGGAGPFGCLDMIGNVREWCVVEQAGGGRVIGTGNSTRGGSWMDASRGGGSISMKADGEPDLGFRCVADFRR